MPILGILASSTRVAAGDFESIATVTVGSGGSSSISFSSIGAGYAHLQLRMLVRTNRTSASSDRTVVRLNGSNATTYYHTLGGNGSSAFAEYDNTANQGPVVWGASTDTNSTSVFGAIVCDILDYANTNKYKTLRALGGFDNNGSGRLDFSSSLYQSTSAVTSITIVPGAGTSFNQHSHFALYGIKSA